MNFQRWREAYWWRKYVCELRIYSLPL